MLSWAYVGIIVFFICVIVKVTNKLNARRNGSYTCLVGKTVIITGANSGIGFETAQDFAARGAKVILACRSKHKAEEAKQKILANTGNVNILVQLIDFASLTLVRNFAKNVKLKEDRLDILVNNAGAIINENITTEDGLSKSMQVNYLGPFLLTMLLLELLKKTKASRIVNLSSQIVRWARLRPNNINWFSTSLFDQTFSVNYANAKLCIILWTNELARRLKDTSVTANSLHPGIVATDIFRDIKGFLGVLYTYSILLVLKTREEGAQTTIYTSVSKELENVSGQYIENCKISSPPKMGLDFVLAQRVWENTIKLLKLTPEEVNI